MYGTMTSNPKWFGLVLEFCPGGDLRKRLDQTATRLSKGQMLRFLMDIAQV